MSVLTDIREKVISIVRDDAGKLVNPDDYDRNINAALSQYSKHRPDTKVTDIAGNGAHDYSLPTGWIDGFSAIKGIEYPIGEVPAVLFESDEYEVYQTTTAKKIRLLNASPSAAESFRLTFTIPRASTTILDNDIDAFTYMAASLCCEELANAYATASDSTISADSVDHRSKSQEYASRAKSLKKLYKEHIGIKEDDITPPASAVTDLDLKYPGGSERLTHLRREREKR